MKEKYNKYNKKFNDLNDKYGKFVIPAIGAVVLILTIYYSPYRKFKNLNKVEAERATAQLLESSEIAEKNFNAGPEILDVPIKPTITNKNILEKSYMHAAGNDQNKFLGQKCNAAAIENYRAYLAAADDLITKFNNGDDYSAELEAMHAIAHPEDIEKILHKFGELLVKDDIDQKYGEVQPFGHLMSKIVKISKKKLSTRDWQARQEVNSGAIKIFTEYLHSKALLEKFVKC